MSESREGERQPTVSREGQEEQETENPENVSGSRTVNQPEVGVGGFTGASCYLRTILVHAELCLLS